MTPHPGDRRIVATQIHPSRAWSVRDGARRGSARIGGAALILLSLLLAASLASYDSADAALNSAPGVTLYLADGHLRTLDAIEADVIRLAIGHYRGRMSEVARRLGIGRSTLYRKLAELGIDSAA